MNNKQFRVLGLIAIGKGLGEVLERRMITEPDGMTPSCISCENFDEPKEICKKFGARPPARTIALGCEHYKDNDEIPFDFPPARA